MRPRPATVSGITLLRHLSDKNSAFVRETGQVYQTVLECTFVPEKGLNVTETFFKPVGTGDVPSAVPTGAFGQLLRKRGMFSGENKF